MLLQEAVKCFKHKVSACIRDGLRIGCRLLWKMELGVKICGYVWSRISVLMKTLSKNMNYD